MNALPSTLNDHRPPADICRERGWGPGTKIVGDEGYGPAVIEITALGEKVMLAKALSLNGQPPTYGDERTWVLYCRDWREVRS